VTTEADTSEALSLAIAAAVAVPGDPVEGEAVEVPVEDEELPAEVVVSALRFVFTEPVSVDALESDAVLAEPRI
jgi:hypothetical protein